MTGGLDMEPVKVFWLLPMSSDEAHVSSALLWFRVLKKYTLMIFPGFLLLVCNKERIFLT